MMQNKYFQIVITLTEKERMMAEQYAEQKGVPIGVAFKQALVNDITDKICGVIEEIRVQCGESENVQ